MDVLVPLVAQQEINLTLNGILALLAGILILAIPGMLRWIVGIYLIIVGLVQIFAISL
jgi:uncharacterized membrane protein HdeD (DUF308 family)